ncbi:MAG: toprim domain-containing protein [Anaplasmataceae bacterium]|nr:toprim domain-containing protein [Anaplasmataceae bacterium]
MHINLLQNKKILDYCLNRNISLESIKHFKLGYIQNKYIIENIENKYENIKLNDIFDYSGLYQNKNFLFNNRLIFPIQNKYKQLIGFAGRDLTEKSSIKYINSPTDEVFQKKNSLYGHSFTTSFLKTLNNKYKNTCIICEGYFDVISIFQSTGIATLAPMGTMISDEHLQIILNDYDDILFALDGDSAGTKAKERIIKNIIPYLSINKTVKFIEFPLNSDPNDFINNNGNIEELLKNALMLSEKLWIMINENINISILEDQIKAHNKINDFIILFKDQNLKKYFTQYFFNKLKYEKYNYFKKKYINKADKLIKITEASTVDFWQKYEAILINISILYPAILQISENEEDFLQIVGISDITKKLSETIINGVLIKKIINKDELIKYLITNNVFDIYRKTITNYNTSYDNDIEKLLLQWKLTVLEYQKKKLDIELHNITHCENKEMYLFYIEERQKINLKITSIISKTKYKL